MKICTTKISVCGRQLLWFRSLDMLSAMQQCRLRATVIPFTAAITACALSRNWQQAIAVFVWLLSVDVMPNYVTYTAAISACARAMQWEAVLRMLQIMENHKRPAISFASHQSSNGIGDKSGPFNAAMGAFEGCQLWPRSLALLSRMQRPERLEFWTPSILTFNAVMSVCAKAQQWALPLQLLDEVRLGVLQPDAISYSIAIVGCSAFGKWVHALSLLADMREARLTRTLSSFGAGLTSCDRGGGRWQDAIRLFDELCQERMTPNVVIYNALMSACARGFRWAHALSLLRSLLIEGIQPQIESFVAVIVAFAGDPTRWRMALALLAELLSCGFQPLSALVIPFNCTIAACAKGKAWVQAWTLLSRMLVLGLRPDAGTFAAMASALSGGVLWPAAFHLLEFYTWQIGSAEDKSMYNFLLINFRTTKHWEQSMALLSHMRSRVIQPDLLLYDASLVTCWRAGQADRAFQDVQGPSKGTCLQMRVSKSARRRLLRECTDAAADPPIISVGSFGLWTSWEFHALRRREYCPIDQRLWGLRMRCPSGAVPLVASTPFVDLQDMDSLGIDFTRHALRSLKLSLR